MTQLKTPLPEKIQGEIVKMGDLEGVQMSIESSTVNEITTDRAHIASVLIAGLKREKRREIQWGNTTLEMKNHMLEIFDAHNQALDTAIALIKSTLTDVTSEEK